MSVLLTDSSSWQERDQPWLWMHVSGRVAWSLKVVSWEAEWCILFLFGIRNVKTSVMILSILTGCAPVLTVPSDTISVRTILGKSSVWRTTSAGRKHLHKGGVQKKAQAKLSTFHCCYCWHSLLTQLFGFVTMEDIGGSGKSLDDNVVLDKSYQLFLWCWAVLCRRDISFCRCFSTRIALLAVFFCMVTHLTNLVKYIHTYVLDIYRSMRATDF